jgi:hypothetical protein
VQHFSTTFGSSTLSRVICSAKCTPNVGTVSTADRKGTSDDGDDDDPVIVEAIGRGPGDAKPSGGFSVEECVGNGGNCHEASATTCPRTFKSRATHKSFFPRPFSPRPFRCVSYRIILHEHLEIVLIVNRGYDQFNPWSVLDAGGRHTRSVIECCTFHEEGISRKMILQTKVDLVRALF